MPTVRYMKEPLKEPACYTFADACAFVEAAEYALSHATTKPAKLEALQDLAIVLLLLDTGSSHDPVIDARVGLVVATCQETTAPEAGYRDGANLTRGAGSLAAPLIAVRVAETQPWFAHGSLRGTHRPVVRVVTRAGLVV